MDSVPPPRFCLSLLGRFELTGPAGVVDLPSKKLAGLLTYLACTAPRSQRRETLSALLWGSHFDLQAKQNLRQALFRLRKVLGQNALEGDGEVVSLNPAAVLSDVGRFEALVREGSRDALRSAAELYRGPLVHDVVFSEEGWSEWLTGERERLLELALGAMVGLGEQELAAGRAEQALRAGQRAIALNNMREDAHRLIVRALAATGRKAEALKHYQDLVTLLKREFNAEPDAATRSLADELRTVQPPSVAKIPEPRPDIDQDAKRAPQRAALNDSASSAVPTGSGDPERRQLSIMACRIVGLPLSAKLDPEDLRDRIGTFHKAVADVAARFDGFVGQRHGDNVLVYFGYPAAHEHDAEQAVRAGLAIVNLVRTLKIEFDSPPQASVGIATGLVVVGEQVVTGATGQHIAIGEAPRLAAQLLAVAAPGDVIIAESTRRLVGRMFDCRAVADDEHKRLPPSVEAWQVRGETAGVSRFEARRDSALSPLVGRHEEMELLLRRWDQAKGGEGRVVLLSGEPGIGKSRIAETLLARLQGEPHVRLRYFCSPHHAQSPLHPFIAQLEHAAGIEPGSNAAAKLDKLEALLKPTAKNAARDLALIADLLSVPSEGRYPPLSVSPQQKREMTLTALLNQLDGVGAQNPVLIVFEDAHWIDPTSLDLLDRIIARVADLPVLLLMTLRPDFRPVWVGQPHVTMQSLSRLDRRDSAGIIAGVTKDKALPDAVVEQVLAHTDGVPLFIEELTSTLIESGLLRETPDRYVLDGPLPPLAIPTTLQDSLVARLDRLASPKDVAQIGAAIGREFSHELIAAVAALAPMELDAALGRLTASGLISRRGTPPHATYAFKHALVRDAAYATMLKSRRQRLHGQIAKALEDQVPDVVASEPEILAHHFAAAGLTERGVFYWQRAGQLASERSANVEAATHFNMGLELLKQLPDTTARAHQELALHVDLGAALIATKGNAAGEVERCYLKARELCLQVGETPELAPILLGLWRFYVTRSRLKTARELGETLLRLAAQDPSFGIVAHYALGVTAMFSGVFVDSRQHFEKGIQRYTPNLRRIPVSQIGQDLGALCRSLSAVPLWFLGYPDRAAARTHDGVMMVSELSHPFALAVARCWAATVSQMCRDVAATLEHAEAALALATEHEFSHWAAFGATLRGWALAMRDEGEEGMAQQSQRITAWRDTGAVVGVPQQLTLLAEAASLLGHVDEGLRSLDEAQAMLEQQEDRWLEAEIYRLRGVLLLQQSIAPHAVAETWLRRALDVARSQQAKSLELRAATSLARLWHAQGQHSTARDLLSPVYGWFTEGFDTIDLRDAKALLAELSA